MSEAKKSTADKTAADVLIEMQLKEQLEKAINPLAVTEEVPVKGDKNDEGVSISTRRVYANGTVMESYS